MNQRLSSMSTSGSRAILFLAALLLPVVLVPSFGGVEQFTVVRAALLAVLACFGMVMIEFSCPGFSSRSGVASIAASIFIVLLFFSNQSVSSNTPLIYFTVLFALFLISRNRSDAKSLSIFISGALAGGVLCSISGILEFFEIIELPTVVNWGNRAAGLFSDPNWFGLHAAMCLLLAMAWNKNDSRILKFLRAIAIPICACALLISGSRSSWSAFALSVPIFALSSVLSMKKSGDSTPLKTLAISLASLVIITLFVSGSATSGKVGFSPLARAKSISESARNIPGGRKNFIDASEIMIKEKPLRGVGGGNFPSEIQRVQGELARSGNLQTPAITRTRHAYNDYLELAATAGIPALVIYIIFLAAVFIPAFLGRPVFSSPGIAASILCYALFSTFFQSAIHNIPSSALLWMLAGFAMGENRNNKIHDPTTSIKLLSFATSCFMAILIFWFGAYTPFMYQHHFTAASKYLTESKTEAAIVNAEKSAALKPHSVEAHFLLSKIAAEAGDETTRLKEILSAIDCLPYDPDLRMMAGERYLNSSQWDEAARHFYKALMLAVGAREQIFLKYSEALLRGDHKDEAIETMKAALAEYPENAELHAQTSRIFFEKRELVDALAAARTAIDLDDTCAVCHIRMSQALFAAGDFRAAYESALAAAALDPYNNYTPRLLSALRRKLDQP